MELCAQLSPMDNTTRGLAADMPVFPPGHGSVPAYTCPQLVPTFCLCQLLSVPCTAGLGLGSCLGSCLQGATQLLQLSLRGYLSCAVLGSLPTCTGVEHHGRAMTAVGASPSSEHPWHIWMAASWLCRVWRWLHIPYHSLLSPLVCTVLLAGPCRVRAPAGPQLDPSLGPSAHPTCGQTMLGCTGAKQGAWLGWGDPKLPQIQQQPCRCRGKTGRSCSRHAGTGGLCWPLVVGGMVVTWPQLGGIGTHGLWGGLREWQSPCGPPSAHKVPTQQCQLTSHWLVTHGEL